MIIPVALTPYALGWREVLVEYGTLYLGYFGFAASGQRRPQGSCRSVDRALEITSQNPAQPWPQTLSGN